MSDAQCGAVSPFWVQLGMVQWAGSGAREKLFCIEYRRCTAHADTPTAIGVHLFPWCAEHARENEAPMRRTIDGTPGNSNAGGSDGG